MKTPDNKKLAEDKIRIFLLSFLEDMEHEMVFASHNLKQCFYTHHLLPMAIIATHLSNSCGHRVSALSPMVTGRPAVSGQRGWTREFCPVVTVRTRVTTA